MNKYTIILILAVSILSCRNTKEIVKSNTESKISAKTEVLKTDETKVDTKAALVKSENTTEDEYTVTEETVTELSKPDTLGKQHPEKVTKRTITSGKNKQTKTTENARTDQKTENKVTEEGTKTEDKVLNNETDIKTVKKSQSWKVITLIVLVLAVIGFIVYKLKGPAIKTAFKAFIK